MNADLFSDHQQVLCILNFNIDKFKQKYIRLRNFKLFDELLFDRDLNRILETTFYKQTQ